MKYFTLLLITLGFISCSRPDSQLVYRINNTSNSTIRVVYTNTNGVPLTGEVSIPSKQLMVIAHNDQGPRRVRYYKEKEDRLSEFSKMDIYRNGSDKARTNFLKTEYWAYKENDSRVAIYTLVVRDMDF